ncbi:Aspartyl/Asparaginyl beta-hydroxylase [Mycolicibacterium rhodesiae JS60]|nr:Aspartyl/Asparaginyl beta-hydroxylase [Mycolicibacterium rhodesiae JS60]
MPDPIYIALERLLDVVENLGRRSWPHQAPILDTTTFPWLDVVVGGCTAIRAESQALLTLLAPNESRTINDLSVGVDGSWKLVPLIDRFGAYPYTDRLPRTMAVLATIPRLRAADLAVLSPRSRIHPHRGNNWGVLRAHLTLIEPAGTGTCALRFTDWGIAHDWRQGEVFIFDDSHRHEAINARDSSRLVLLFEFDRPLPRLAAKANSVAQYWYRYHPVQRGVRARVVARYRDQVDRPAPTR